jgi:hypothetical protein
MVMGGRVEIHDVAISSVGVEHEMPLDLGSRTFLEFRWNDVLFRLSCHVARTREASRAGWFRSGLTIDADHSEAQLEFSKRVKAGLTAMREAEEKLPPVV